MYIIIYIKIKIGKDKIFSHKIKPRLCRSLGQGGQKLVLEPAVRGGYSELVICQKTWENRYSVIAAISYVQSQDCQGCAVAG